MCVACLYVSIKILNQKSWKLNNHTIGPFYVMNWFEETLICRIALFDSQTDS